MKQGKLEKYWRRIIKHYKKEKHYKKLTMLERHLLNIMISILGDGNEQ